ncbi:MAG: hypothetical protein QM638_21985, partial [Nocardioides sp.]|uniref:sulfotransferase family protein n=1 Tax=Nocardioides sp. TaxID=35761 RepID=UPI0039E5E20A
MTDSGGAPEQTRPTAILVSGMHRSGTSALTRMLSLLGAGLPQHLIPGRERDNAPGFWEGRSVVDLNEDVLARRDQWWGGWGRLDPAWLRRRAGLVRQVQQILAGEFGGEEQIVIKDPRLSRTMPLWIKALEEGGYRCVHVVAVRDPQAVAGSIRSRNGLDPRGSLLSWLAHSLDAEEHTREAARVFVSFEALLADWRREADRIGSALAIDWSRDPGEAASEIDEFLRPDLVHEAAARKPGRPYSVVAPVARVLRRWSADEVRRQDAAQLDGWREQLAPVRGAASPVTHLARLREETLAKRRRATAEVPAQAWIRMRTEALDLEAAQAWAQLTRQRAQARALRSAERELDRLRRLIADAEARP